MSIDPKKPLNVSDLGGGRYKWTRNPDNTYNVLMVPIMTSLHANEFPSPTNLKPIDRTWLQAAIDKANLREAEGHFGSVHENHHGSGLPDVYAGKLQLWEIGSIDYNGERRDCLYANLLRVPEVIFKRMQTGELVYRSIEGISWENPEIVSLALMATETPFWRLPMLTLGEEASQYDIIAKLNPRLAASLSNEGGIKMAEDKKVEEKVEPKAVAIVAALPTPPPAPPEKKEEKEEKKEVKVAPSETGMKGGTAPGGTPEAPGMQVAPGGVSAEENLENHVRAFIKGCSKYIKSELVDVEKPEEKKPAEQVNASDKVELAAKQAKIDVLESQLAQKTQEEKVLSLVAQAEKSLIGLRITDTIRASIREFAALGEKPLAKYTEAIKASLPQAAPKDPEQTTQPIASVIPGEAEIMGVIQDQPPAIHARARQLMEMGRRYIAATNSTSTLKEYVLLNLKREGVRL